MLVRGQEVGYNTRMVRPTRLAVIAFVPLVALGGCGDGYTEPTPTPAPTVTVTKTFTGSTTQTSASSCGGDSHNFTAAGGAMSVTLVATSDPAAALSIQVCANGIDNRNCSINQQRITVGQTLSGTRIGDATQNLKALPNNCVFGGPLDTTPRTYTFSLTHQQ